MTDLTRMDRDAVASVMLDAGGTEVESNSILARAKALLQFCESGDGYKLSADELQLLRDIIAALEGQGGGDARRFAEYVYDLVQADVGTAAITQTVLKRDERQRLQIADLRIAVKTLMDGYNAAVLQRAEAERKLREAEERASALRECLYGNHLWRSGYDSGGTPIQICQHCGDST